MPKKYRNGRNDCLRQCVAILTKRKPHKVPHFVGLYGGRWIFGLSRWLQRHGYAMFIVPCRGRGHWNSDNSGPWIAIGPSARRTSDDHATVVSNDGVVWNGGIPIRRATRILLIWKRR